MNFSWFEHFYSKTPQNCVVNDWGEFVSTMKSISEVEGFKPPMGDFVNKQPLISSAIYEDGSERLNENVVGWDFIMLDIDDGIDKLDDVLKHFSLFSYIIYSTANCTKEKLKIRVCIPLDKRAPKDQLHGIWFALNEWCDHLLDKATKDKARLHFIPARYTNKGDLYNHIFLVNDGLELNWGGLMAKYPAPPEKDKFKVDNPLRGLKRKIFESNNVAPVMDITRSDCPFVYPRMIDDYRLTPAGGHHSAIYKFMVTACYQASKIDYPITVEELSDMGRQLDDMDGGFYPDSKLLGSAKDAIEYTCV